jgi:hypothetical protein
LHSSENKSFAHVEPYRHLQPTAQQSSTHQQLQHLVSLPIVIFDVFFEIYTRMNRNDVNEKAKHSDH